MRTNGIACWIGVVVATAGVGRGGDIPIVEGVPEGFEVVRLTHDPTRLHSVPDINNQSEVVWTAFTLPDFAKVYKFWNGAIWRLFPGESYDANPVINNLSQIVWLTGEDTFGPFDLVTTYTEGPIEAGYEVFAGTDANDLGDVVWDHQRGDGTRDIFLYTHLDGTVRQLSKSGGNNQVPRINSAGQVVWTSFNFKVSPWVGEIMLYTDGEITQVNPQECPCQSADLNDAGHVVYRDGSVNGVVLWDGSTTRTIASKAFTPRINKVGEIAMALWDPELKIVVHSIYKEGIIYQLPNFDLTTARESLNDRGEMAMKSIDPDTGNSDLFLLRRGAPKGDFDHSCTVDMYDLWIFQRCVMAEPGPEGTLLAECARADFDDDADVGLDDFAAFVEAFTGPNVMLDDCEP